MVEEDSISISEEASGPAPAPAPRSNVYFGIAGLEMADDVPEPAPAPRRAPAPAPAPAARSNVHYGIAGLEEMSDDGVAEDSFGTGSNAVSISMDSLQELSNLDESVDIAEESDSGGATAAAAVQKKANVHFGIAGLEAAASEVPILYTILLSFWGCFSVHF